MRWWWLDLRRAIAYRTVCRFWDCKPFGEYGWAPRYIGKWDKQAAALGTCEKCGRVIPVADAK